MVNNKNQINNNLIVKIMNFWHLYKISALYIFIWISMVFTVYFYYYYRALIQLTYFENEPVYILFFTIGVYFLNFSIFLTIANWTRITDEYNKKWEFTTPDEIILIILNSIYAVIISKIFYNFMTCKKYFIDISGLRISTPQTWINRMTFKWYQYFTKAKENYISNKLVDYPIMPEAKEELKQKILELYKNSDQNLDLIISDIINEDLKKKEIEISALKEKLAALEQKLNAPVPKGNFSFMEFFSDHWVGITMTLCVIGVIIYAWRTDAISISGSDSKTNITDNANNAQLNKKTNNLAEKINNIQDYITNIEENMKRIKKHLSNFNGNQNSLIDAQEKVKLSMQNVQVEFEKLAKATKQDIITLDSQITNARKDIEHIIYETEIEPRPGSTFTGEDPVTSTIRNRIRTNVPLRDVLNDAFPPENVPDELWNRLAAEEAAREAAKHATSYLPFFFLCFSTTCIFKKACTGNKLSNFSFNFKALSKKDVVFWIFSVIWVSLWMIIQWFI